MYRQANSEVLDEMTQITRVLTVCYMFDIKESSEKEMHFFGNYKL